MESVPSSRRGDPSELATMLEQDRDLDAIRQSQERERTTQSEVDGMLAREMNSLSVQERERVFQDIHGVADPVEETPELTERCLLEMDGIIDAMPVGQKKDYLKALAMNAAFAKDRRTRLMYLRGYDFKVPTAARAFVKYFWAKRELFGEEALVSPFMQSMLNDDDVQCLRNGHLQLLPRRDRSGRSIIVLCINHQKFRVIANQLRAAGYIVWTAGMDEETQRKGVVVVVFNIGSFSAREFDPGMIVAAGRLFESFPFRIVGFHHCFSSPLFWPFALLHRRMVPGPLRARSREHFGSYLECMYELMTFGIPTDVIPVKQDGTLLTDSHHQWLRAMAQLETRRQSNNRTPSPVLDRTTVVVPTKHDVLFGRGNATHIGNYNFNQLIEDCRQEYDAASKTEKTAIAWRIVTKIKAKTGRFLRMESGAWKVVDDTVARKRVSQSFRSQRRMDHKATNRARTVKRSIPVLNGLTIDLPETTTDFTSSSGEEYSMTSSSVTDTVADKRQRISEEAL